MREQLIHRHKKNLGKSFAIKIKNRNFVNSIMKTICLKHIGPITDSGVIEISPVTIFCGRQGSGKSTIAKLVSTCMWLEKALVRGEVTKKYALRYNNFKNHFCRYHGIEDFFGKESYLEYDSGKYKFVYQDEHLSIEENADVPFSMPKIMYVPAERNIMVVIEHAERIRKLPLSLQAIQAEYLKALQSIKGESKLPIDGVSVQYDRQNKITWFHGHGFRVRAQYAASGFQSVAPLALVSNYLSDMVNSGKGDPLSNEEKEKLRVQVSKIQDNKRLSDEVKAAMIDNINNRYLLDSFQNLVEEPEQNLYPSSQRNVLNMLLSDFNKKEGNGLIITTHSPYILDYLSLNVKAWIVYQKHAEKAEAIGNIVPLRSMLNPARLALYEILDDGNVKRLESYDGIPSDNNFLNNALADVNELYGELMEIEDEEG